MNRSRIRSNSCSIMSLFTHAVNGVHGNCM